MNSFKKMRWFQTTATGMTFFYFGIMIAVAILAYAKRSGSTGLDMAKIQVLRYEASIAGNEDK